MKKVKNNKEKHPDKVATFTIVKYFTLTSFLLMFVGTIALSTFHTHLVRNIILTKSQDYAKVLVENLNHQIFLQFVLPVFLNQGKIQLRKENQYKRMDQVVKSTLHSFRISLVNIYDLNNIISYSFNKEIIGEKDIGGIGFQNALHGKMTTYLHQTGSFFKQLIRYPDTAMITTFAPLRAERPNTRLTGPILGVIEIVQDVSKDYRRIFKLQLMVILTTIIVMAVLFLILRQIVKNGEYIVLEKSKERYRLKEELNRARHLSAIGEMTAIISHEIKNPLGIIRSSAEYLSNKLESLQKESKLADVILEESNRMNQIINDFLAFARPTKTKFMPCNINQLIKKNIDHLKHEFINKNIRVITDLKEDLPLITGDENQLYQCFLNILINSMEAIENEGHIFIETAMDKNHLSILFTDTGPGVPDQILYKIKDPFFTTKTNGSGLGLGIVEQTITNHGGKLNIDNSKENGAKIAIKLPLTDFRIQ